MVDTCILTGNPEESDTAEKFNVNEILTFFGLSMNTFNANRNVYDHLALISSWTLDPLRGFV